MNKRFDWAQIIILHDEGMAIIGRAHSYTSTSQDSKLLKYVPVAVPKLDLHGVNSSRISRKLQQYVQQGTIDNVKWLVEELENMK